MEQKWTRNGPEMNKIWTKNEQNMVSKCIQIKYKWMEMVKIPKSNPRKLNQNEPKNIGTAHGEIS